MDVCGPVSRCMNSMVCPGIRITVAIAVDLDGRGSLWPEYYDLSRVFRGLEDDS